jgi:DNA-binding ferritin-like protein
VCPQLNRKTNEQKIVGRRQIMSDLLAEILADDIFAEELQAGRTKRRTNPKIKRRRRMRTQTKNLRKRNTNQSQRRKNRKKHRKKMRTDPNYRKNRQDYRKKYYKRHKKSSVGYSLPFNLEFAYEGKPAYLMSLSEMFDAINIYVDGETAIVVDLNDFLDRVEWYEREDMEMFFDLIDGSYAVLEEDPQDAWAEFTLEESDAPAKRKIDKKSSVCNRTDNLAILQMLLAVLRGAHFAHWTSHWQVKGSNFYGDHELMERVYTSLIEEIDTLAEKIVGTYGVEAVNAVEQAQLMANHLLPLAEAHSMNDPIRRAFLIEEGLQVIFKNTYDMLKEQGGLTLGMDDFIMSMANAHETNLYLLRQRCDTRPKIR